MILTARLCRPAHVVCDGAGGLIREGRWHEKGYRVVYFSESEAFSAFEVLVHLSSLDQIPDYVCIKASIPKISVVDIRDLGVLPANWNRHPEETRRIGTRWLIEVLRGC